MFILTRTGVFFLLIKIRHAHTSRSSAYTYIYIFNLDQQWGKDIAESIQQMNYVDMKKFLPIKDESTETESKLKKQQNESFEMIFKEEIKIYSERKTMLEKNKSSAAALIKSNYCTITMRNKLKEEDESVDDGNKKKSERSN